MSLYVVSLKELIDRVRSRTNEGVCNLSFSNIPSEHKTLKINIKDLATTAKENNVKTLTINSGGFELELFGGSKNDYSKFELSIRNYEYLKISRAKVYFPLSVEKGAFEKKSPSGVGSFELKNSKVEYLSLVNHCKAVIDGSNQIKTLEIHETDSKSLISDLNLKKLILNGTPEGALRNVKCVDMFSSQVSEITPLNIIGLNLEKTKEIRIYDFHKFLNIRREKITWRTKKVENQITSLYALRGLYNRLKGESTNRHDKIEAIDFFELEMETYRNLLKSQKGKLSERFILCTSQVFSKHGQSYMRPALSFVLFGSLFYGMTEILDCQRLMTSKEWLLFMLDITQKISDHRNSWAIFFHAFWKVIYAYLVYQILTAFRKYSRKI
jgi:hypothetical protein